MTGGAAAARTAVRPLGGADLEALAKLHRLCFPEDPWDRRALAGVLAMPGARGWLAESAAVEDGGPGAGGAGRAAGFLLVRAAADEAEVLTLGVAPQRRRAGIAGQLLSAALAALAAAGVRRLFLEVAVDNDAARALYEARGFAAVGRRAAYLPGPDGPRDALILACALDG